MKITLEASKVVFRSRKIENYPKYQEFLNTLLDGVDLYNFNMKFVSIQHHTIRKKILLFI
jgi:hypothetical protein